MKDYDGPLRLVKRGIGILLTAVPLAAFAQADLSPHELEGMRLFNQSCRVCHTKPQPTSEQYGPTLSRTSAGGNDGAMRVFISNGTAKMPGFRYHFKPAEIDAIVAYLKTIPSPD
jgi:mono/diheme cytochrome c family protein